ncbi:uncharacterized protein LOC126795106 [Argentina anserina]|uniref:uncharacterized protein LOC126795106 n=1 Tax=Argentina anserina TaxID=57926 RepID=UPI0021767107|nr:uncharacterized protein LOC126795106 [Potentilla anserina]
MACCLPLQISMVRKRCMGSRLGYRPLTEEGFGERESPVTVVVGKEKREFLVDPFVLEESPFRVLIETMNKNSEVANFSDRRPVVYGKERVVFVDVDAILFEHMLWLLYNDCSSLFKLNLKEIIDFYTQDY